MVYRLDLIENTKKMAVWPYLRKLRCRIEGHQKSPEEIAQLGVMPYFFQQEEHCDLIAPYRHEWLSNKDSNKSVEIGGFATVGAVIYMYPAGQSVITHAQIDKLPFSPFSNHVVGHALDIDAIDRGAVKVVLSFSKAIADNPQIESQLESLLADGIAESNIYIFSSVKRFGLDASGHIGTAVASSSHWVDSQLQWFISKLLIKAMGLSIAETAAAPKKKGFFSRRKKSPLELGKALVRDLQKQMAEKRNTLVVLKQFLEQRDNAFVETVKRQFSELLLATLPTLFSEKIKVSGDPKHVQLSLLSHLKQQLSSGALSFNDLLNGLEPTAEQQEDGQSQS